MIQQSQKKYVRKPCLTQPISILPRKRVAKRESNPPSSKKGGVGKKSRVFLVHGHNHSSLYQVHNFLSDVNLDVIILKDEAGGGKTIIEKFEKFSDVEFVVVLLTPDDKGGTVTTLPKDQRFRARQNVIFELGYFAGKLGRAKVCALAAHGIEMPSDFSGVEYIALDEDGGWRWKLARELKIAQLFLDLNGALEPVH